MRYVLAYVVVCIGAAVSIPLIVLGESMADILRAMPQ